MSLKKKIKKYAKDRGWIHGGDIERFGLKKGYKASTASRRARELAEEGVLKRKENDKGHVLYKHNPEQLKAL